MLIRSYLAPLVATFLTIKSLGLAHESNELRPPAPPLPVTIENNSNLLARPIPSSVTVADFTKKLELLTGEMDRDSSVDNLIQCIDNYCDLCKKDFNRKVQELCFQVAFDPHNSSFDLTHKAFQAKISEKLIAEFDLLQDYNKVDAQYLEKVSEISRHLGNLRFIRHLNPIFKLTTNQKSALTAIQDDEFCTVGSLPQLEDFFQTKLLPSALRLKPVTGKDPAKLRLFIKSIHEFTLLNIILNKNNSLTDKNRFFINIHSQLIDCFVRINKEPNIKIRNESLLNLESCLTYLMDYLSKYEIDYLPFPRDLQQVLSLRFNSQTNRKKAYYQAINLYPEYTNLTKESLKQVQRDLIRVIQGTASETTKSMVREFLALSLAYSIQHDPKFEKNFHTFVENSSPGLNSKFQMYRKNFSGTKTPLLNLFEITLNPDFFIAAYSDPSIAKLFKVKPSKECKVDDLIKFNQQYLNALNFLESVFLAANFKLSIPEKIYKFNQAYAYYEGKLARKFSLEERRFHELSWYIDAFIQGRALGHYLESQLITPRILIQPDSPNFSMAYHQIKKDPYTHGNLRTVLDPCTFPATKILPSRLALNFSAGKTLSLKENISEIDKVFILGALTAIPNVSGNEFDPAKYCERRYKEIIRLRYPDKQEIFLHPDNKDYFITTAENYIRAHNPNIFKEPKTLTL